MSQEEGRTTRKLKRGKAKQKERVRRNKLRMATVRKLKRGKAK